MRQEYEEFLERVPGDYEVCEVDGKVLGAFGLFVNGENMKTLNWILLDPQTQGIGVGSTIMERVDMELPLYSQSLGVASTD